MWSLIIIFDLDMIFDQRPSQNLVQNLGLSREVQLQTRLKSLQQNIHLEVQLQTRLQNLQEDLNQKHQIKIKHLQEEEDKPPLKMQSLQEDPNQATKLPTKVKHLQEEEDKPPLKIQSLQEDPNQGLNLQAKAPMQHKLLQRGKEVVQERRLAANKVVNQAPLRIRKRITRTQALPRIILL